MSYTMAQVHALVTPMIQMGALRSNTGVPFTYTANFIAFNKVSC